MRGVPGSGKTTLACCFPQASFFEADQFFLDLDGKYHFVPRLLDTAHKWCQKRVKTAMEKGDAPLIISNTNLEKWQFEPYLKMAEEFGYTVQYIIVHTPGQQNTHGCSEEKVKSMERRLLDSLCKDGF